MIPRINLNRVRFNPIIRDFCHRMARCHVALFHNHPVFFPVIGAVIPLEIIQSGFPAPDVVEMSYIHSCIIIRPISFYLSRRICPSDLAGSHIPFHDGIPIKILRGVCIHHMTDDDPALQIYIARSLIYMHPVGRHCHGIICRNTVVDFPVLVLFLLLLSLSGSGSGRSIRLIPVSPREGFSGTVCGAQNPVIHRHHQTRFRFGRHFYFSVLLQSGGSCRIFPLRGLYGEEKNSYRHTGQQILPVLLIHVLQ